jgi:flagellar basal body L-ring protein FlgH
LLAECDTLVAGMRSTFTQILPLSLIFAADRSLVNNTTTKRTAAAQTRRNSALWKFCETDGYSLTCFRDRQAWLFRQDTALQQGRIRTIRIANGNSSSSSSGDDSGSDQHHLSVVHKVMVHLPDVESEPALQKVRAFLSDDETGTATTSDGTRIFPYGDRINSKYRTAKNKGQGWTWVDA